MDGLLVVDKPAGPTSHDVVARCRRIFGQRRVGHAGTLDPPATGVLCVGLGKATRLMRYLSGLDKRYTCEVVLGASTTTLDDTGEVVSRSDLSGIEDGAVLSAAASLEGRQLLAPPMVSAVKVGGKKLYEMAREGIEIEREPREVEVMSIELSPLAPPELWKMDVSCSSGTYVRVLAEELGRRVGVGAHLRRLRRLAVGTLTEQQALSLERIAELGPAAVLAPSACVSALPQRVLESEELIKSVRSGRPLPAGSLEEPSSGPHALVLPGGELLAVYVVTDEGTWRAEVVMAATPPLEGESAPGVSPSSPGETDVPPRSSSA